MTTTLWFISLGHLAGAGVLIAVGIWLDRRAVRNSSASHHTDPSENG